MSVNLFHLASTADHPTSAYKGWTIRIQHCTRNGNQHHLSSGMALLSASADFGYPWTGDMHALHSDPCHKIFKPQNGTSAWCCTSTLGPHQCCSHHDSNWPPFNFSSHGGISSFGPDISLTWKHQVYWFSPRPWCLTHHHSTLAGPSTVLKNLADKFQVTIKTQEIPRSPPSEEKTDPYLCL